MPAPWSHIEVELIVADYLTLLESVLAGKDYSKAGHQRKIQKLLELKSTKLSKEAPFYFTRNELHFSTQHAQDYHLYRLFNLNEEAKMFIKKGDLGTICHAVPITFQGYF